MADWDKISKGYADAMNVVKEAADARAGYSLLVQKLAKRVNTPLWPALAKIDIGADVTLLRSFLATQLADAKCAGLTGLYFGLDTLNMRGGRGTNLELGGSPAAPTDRTAGEWVYKCSWHAKKKHLISGLYAMHRLYKPFDDEDLSQFLEMPLWVGYTGLVIADAFARKPSSTLLGAAGRRTLVWGHHDGDLFVLGNAGREGFEKIAKPVHTF